MNPFRRRLDRLSAAHDANQVPPSVHVIVGDLGETERACRQRLGVPDGTAAIFVSVADQSTPRDTPKEKLQ